MKKTILALWTAAVLMSVWCDSSKVKSVNKDTRKETSELLDMNKSIVSTPITIKQILAHGIGRTQQIGQVNVFDYDYKNTMLPISFVNDPQNQDLWFSNESGVFLNVAQLQLTYQFSTTALIQSWLQQFTIPFDLFVESILNQEIYHFETQENWSEMESDQVSMRTPGAWLFYLYFRLTGTILGKYSNPNEFNERLHSWAVNDVKGYTEQIAVYQQAINSVDPEFVKKCGFTWNFEQDLVILNRYLENNPWFLFAVKNKLLK
jgi:hypothetical protein